MTLLYLRHDDTSGIARGDGASLPRFVRRIGVSFRLLHRAIVRARLRRISRELLFRRDYDDMLPLEQDATKFPRRPLVLGDKWDF
jgi:hypothetical protein